MKIFYKVYSSWFFNFVYKFYFFIIRIFESSLNYNYNKKNNPTLSLENIRNYNRSRIKGPKKIICNAPFTNAYINNSGNVLPCCKNVFNSFGNIKNDSFENIWKSKEATSFRNKILNYELEGGCESCKYAINTGNYDGALAKIYDKFLPIQKYDFPNEITFELSNICNLECVMCQGEFSHLIRKNREELPAISIVNENFVLDNLKPYLNKLKEAKFVGGEPFLIDIYYDIWNYLITNNKKCKIYILTNGTVLNNKVKKILSGGNIQLSISVDALEKDIYEKIRINAEFEKMHQNLLFFLSYNNKNKNTLNINYCLMNNNWKQLPLILDFCQQHFCSINILSVEQPENKSIRYLKPENIEKIISYYNDNIYKYNNQLLKPFIDIINLLKEKVVESRNSKIQILKFEALDYNTNLEYLLSIYKKNILNNYDNVYEQIQIKLNSYSVNDKNRVLARYLTELMTWYENLGLLKVADNTIISKTKIRFDEIYKELDNTEMN